MLRSVRSILYGGLKVSRQFQFAYGSFNFAHGSFNFAHDEVTVPISANICHAGCQVLWEILKQLPI